MTLTTGQLAALESSHPRELWCVTRQGGKSTVAGILAVHAALTQPGELVLLLSPTLRQSSELFRKAAQVYHALGGVVPAEAESALRLELRGGSRIISLPGSSATIRAIPE